MHEPNKATKKSAEREHGIMYTFLSIINRRVVHHVLRKEAKNSGWATI
jgi:hypothetical protein